MRIIGVKISIMITQKLKVPLYVITLISIAALVHLASSEDVKKEELMRSSEITVPGLDLNQITERIATARLGTVPKDCKEPPLLIWLIDNTSYIETLRCHELLAQAISKELSKYKLFQIALVKFGTKTEVILNPTDKLNAINRAISDIFQKTDNVYKDYCEAIRFCTTSFRDYPGKKHLIIFTLQNNCIDCKLEETLESLKGNMTLDVISGGTVFQFTSPEFRPEKLDYQTQTISYESPEAEFNRGYRAGTFNSYSPYFYNNYVSSGYGYYGLSRLAAYSGGKYYLYSPPTNAKSKSFCELHYCAWCGMWGTTPTKTKKKQPHDCSTPYTKLIPAFAPMLVSRKYYPELYKNDPFYKFRHNQKSTFLVRDVKTVFKDGDKVSPEVFKQIENEIQNYTDDIQKTEQLIDQVKDKCDFRFRANAMVLLAEFYIERFNLYQYKSYLEQVEKPNQPNYASGYIHAMVECLCHMELSAKDKDKNNYVNTTLRSDIDKIVKEMLGNSRMKVYGNTKVEEELTAALMGVAKTIIEYKNTPWELVARRIPLAMSFYIQPTTNYNPPPTKQPPLQTPETTTGPTSGPNPHITPD